jgi:peptide subunit release factor 1 (eRF1)
VPRFVGRENVRKRLSGLREGRTVYSGGAARIEAPDETITVRPPFGLSHEALYESLVLEPLFEELFRDRVVAAVLVRLGGFAVGVFEGERLVASKVGTRFVKGRHKKGGSSSGRFRRRREEQARSLIDAAVETTVHVLEPWRERIEFVAFGGDRRAVDQLLEDARLAWLAEKRVPRFFTTEDPRQRTLEHLPYDLYAAEVETISIGSPQGEQP